MRSKNLQFVAMTVAAALLAAGVGRAGVLEMGEGLISLEFAPVRNAGNPGDAAHNGRGVVAYDFEIGKYEVTAGQYAVFLNAVAKGQSRGLYNRHMFSNELGCQIRQIDVEQTKSPKVPGGLKVPVSHTYIVSAESANRPVNFVSFWAAARFANWLHNGQGNGDTETGAYTLKGYKDGDGREITRNPGAKYWIPSENEWYKAAYHKNDGKTGNYFEYPAGSNAVPTAERPPGDGMANGSANYRSSLDGDETDKIGRMLRATTPVGAYNAKDSKGRFVSASPYGTFDQGGNVWEWTDTVFKSERGLRGGSFSGYEGKGALRSDSGKTAAPTTCSLGYGFRVARAPEKR